MLNVYTQLAAAIEGRNSTDKKERENNRKDIKRFAEKIRDQAQTTEDILDAAFCYYLSGYYVHAQTLANADFQDARLVQKWVLYFLAKKFEGLRVEILSISSDSKYQDASIRDGIYSGVLNHFDVVNSVVEVKTSEALLGFISFIETGNIDIYNQSFETLSACQKLLCKAGDWQTWWWIEILKTISQEFVESSLWRTLEPFCDNAVNKELVSKYIHANYEKLNIVEFWKTQIECFPKINDPERCSFCISVPTSAGKTKVGELAILRFLLDFYDQPDKKCVYIAPLKKLCFEVEETFNKSFSKIQRGIVSSFYGYSEVDVFDEYVLKHTKILVVTPEKLDAMLRQYPDLASQIKLVIADEGHIIGEANKRGYKYRFLLERLICILDRKSPTNTVKPRIIFVSGVLPYMEDFADLISGSKKNVVKIDWRPVEEPKIGSWTWDGRKFITSKDELPVILPFQSWGCQEENKFEEHVVLTAIQCAYASFTMVFSASKKVLQYKKFHEFLQCLLDNNQVQFPVSDPPPAELQKYPFYYSLLTKGIAIHHSDVPSEIKREVEKRISNGNVRLLFASPTLAQGVNIPFDTVLAYRLHHSYYPQYMPISESVFWNVVGRVGRPISYKKKTASTLESPRLIFMLNGSKSADIGDKKDLRLSEEIQKKEGGYRVASPFLRFLSVIRDRTTLSPQNLVIELSEKENLNSIVGDLALEKFGELTLEQYLIMLDRQLYDLLHESYLDINDASALLQETTAKLIDLFVKATDFNIEDLSYIKEVVSARLSFIIKNTSVLKRRQEYLLGLPHDDSEQVKKHIDQLLSWYRDCSNIFSGNLDFGIDNLVNLMVFVASLSICSKNRQLPHHDDLVRQEKADKRARKKSLSQISLYQNWIKGDPESKMEKSLKGVSTIEFSRYKETVIDRIPWGISAITRYISVIAEERGLSFSKDLEYLSSFVKYGVNSKISCHLVRLGISRVEAVVIGNAYVGTIKKTEYDEEEPYFFETDFRDAIKSLDAFSLEDLENMNITKETISRISEIREKYKTSPVDHNELDIPPFEYYEDVFSNDFVD